MYWTRKLLFTSTAGLALTTAVHAQGVRELGFEDRPSYYGSKEIALTFDDGPDWSYTAQVLDILRNKGVKASFFINGNNWSNIDTDGPMQDLVRRMVNEGHDLGNHTLHHDHLPMLSSADIENEITSVERSVNRIFNGNRPRLTLLRAPHGEPYQNREPDFDRVAGIVARYAVHIGWNIDSQDWACAPGDGDCVRNNVLSEIDNGKYGVVLMHSVQSQTVAALPDLIDELRRRGFTFKSTEDGVRRKYGASSAELLGGGGAPSGISPQAGRVYELVARHSGKCLDVAEASRADGGNLQQWACSRGSNQRFLLERNSNGYRLKAVASGKCVDVDGTGNGANIQQWACHDGANQRVSLTPVGNGHFRVAFAHSQACLDVSGPSMANGANVHHWQCFTGASNQEWLFRAL